jgi:hypothetical protein
MGMSGKRKLWLGLKIIGILSILLSVFSTNLVSATGQITSRSLTLIGTAPTVGGSEPGATVDHLFAFTLPNVGGGNVGSILFQYCTLAIGTCVTPQNLSTTSTTLGTQTGATGFTLNNTTNGSPYLTRTASAIAASTAVTYELDSVINPNVTATPNYTFYVRISSYLSTNTTGSEIDEGNVAAATAIQIVLTGIMPESLVFCTGGTIGTTSGVPDCTTATSGAVSFDQLFSPTAAATATSQMAASTNAGSGYNITVNGPTLTSGSNTLPEMNPAATPAWGNSEFGMNLVANSTASSTPAVGTNVAPAANGTSYRGQAIGGYSTTDEFQFNTGDSIANSANGGGGAGPTNAQIFTVSYIANVSGSQPAGTYSTTLTYICTPTF